MKKISIILSTVVAAAVLALASCSNVTELNGNQYDSYKAESDAAAKAASDANKIKVIVTCSNPNFKHDDGVSYVTKYFEATGTVPDSITYDLANAATADVDKETKTLTMTFGSLSTTYKNAKVDKYATSVTFNIDKEALAKGKKFSEIGVFMGTPVTATSNY